jgi:hypothetical protein
LLSSFHGNPPLHQQPCEIHEQDGCLRDSSQLLSQLTDHSETSVSSLLFFPDSANSSQQYQSVHQRQPYVPICPQTMCNLIKHEILEMQQALCVMQQRLQDLNLIISNLTEIIV